MKGHINIVYRIPGKLVTGLLCAYAGKIRLCPTNFKEQARNYYPAASIEDMLHEELHIFPSIADSYTGLRSSGRNILVFV